MTSHAGDVLGHYDTLTGSPNFASLVEDTRGTTVSEIDRLVNSLHEHSDDWVHVSLPERISILDQIRADLVPLKNRWVEAELGAKGNPPGGGGEAEEWLILATVFRAIRKLKRSLVEIDKFGRPKLVGQPGPVGNGRTGVRVFPKTLDDRALFPGVTGEVWMAPGVSAEDVVNAQAWAYHDRNRQGKVVLILGAGNAAILPVADLLHKMFVELQVVVLKMNPVNEHMGPFLERGFRALIDRGYLAVVYGGVEQGSYLCSHPQVDELHLTGSDKTYEAIVFGTGEAGRKRKSLRDPKLTKRFTAELGNVSPVIVVPGPWSEREIERQARYFSTWLVANGGFACLTPRVLVQQATWEHRRDYLDAIGDVLTGVPTRTAYYPGADQRHAEYIKQHPQSREYGDKAGGRLPWIIVPDVDPSGDDEICFRREAFCGLCAETGIDAPDAEEFLDRAVRFANERLWGTLSATLIVHPASLRDKHIAQAVERAIANLNYGTVSLNMLAYYSAYLMGTPWGAHPGSEIHDIQSGIGKTFNTLMFAHPAKSVVRAPFTRLEPTEVTSTHAVELCRALAEYEAAPSIGTMVSLGLLAVRS